jgi:2-polyprenyl-6-methoxyphenol hydroxylase-like FAD-dependent oxidoreductase
MGGIGINLAIQDAVAAANMLAEPLASGRSVDHLLKRVQRRRYASTAIIQAVQKVAHNRVLAPVLRRAAGERPPWPLLVLEWVPLLRRLPGRAIAYGIRRERIAHA